MPIKPGKYSGRDYFGLALSFTITMIVSIMITSWCGKWLDAKLGTPGGFWLLGVLGGIYSGFHLFIEQIDRIENPIDAYELAPKVW